jgi:HEPN domain-containing protein
MQAVLIQQGQVFPYTHDLAQLITRGKDTGSLWPESLDAAAALTVYAVGTRYPGGYGDIPEDEYTQALAIAQQVLDWAESVLHGSDGS